MSVFYDLKSMIEIPVVVDKIVEIIDLPDHLIPDTFLEFERYLYKTLPVRIKKASLANRHFFQVSKSFPIADRRISLKFTAIVMLSSHEFKTYEVRNIFVRVPEIAGKQYYSIATFREEAVGNALHRQLI
jgi:hypothetical protein